MVGLGGHWWLCLVDHGLKRTLDIWRKCCGLCIRVQCGLTWGVVSGGVSRGVSGSKRKVSGSKGKVSGSKGKVSGSKRKVSGSRGRVSGSKGKVSGSRGRVSDGFRRGFSGFRGFLILAGSSGLAAPRQTWWRDLFGEAGVKMRCHLCIACDYPKEGKEKLSY